MCRPGRARKVGFGIRASKAGQGGFWLAAACVLVAGSLTGCGVAAARASKPSAPIHHYVIEGGTTGCGLGGTPVSECPPSELSLVVVPHPDDEISSWSMIENTPSDYKVFIDLTQGEDIGSCDSRSGPWTYDKTPNAAGQLPGGDPPGGGYFPGVDAWVGTVQEQIEAGDRLPNPGCREARLGSQEDFITKEAAYDPSLPSFSGSPPVQPAEWCFSSEPNGKDPCMEVVANSKGAIVSFDLGDDDWCNNEIDCGNASPANAAEAAEAALAAHPYAVQPSDVAWAVQNVAQYASTFLPVSLPVGKIIDSGFFNADGRLGTRWNPTNATPSPPSPSDAGKCGDFGQPQHWATETALQDWTLVANVPQYGRTCSSANYAVFQSIDPTTYHRLMGDSSSTVVDGEWPTAYAWLYGTGLNPPGGVDDPLEMCNTSAAVSGTLPAEGVTSCNQAFFGVEEPTVSVDYVSPTPPQTDPNGPWDYTHGNWKA